MSDEKTRTKGNVIVENIKIGDIHYEFEYGSCVKSMVTSKPEFVDGVWNWKSVNVNSGSEINYVVNPEYTHYSVNLYDYEAYVGCKMI